MMDNQFKNIGIIGKHNRDQRVAETISTLHHFLKQQGYSVFIDNESVQLLSLRGVESCEMDSLGEKSDLVIAIGGDGTFLKAARTVVKHDVPLVGINLGRLGFLVDISPEDIYSKLNDILRGHYLEEKRNLLHTEIIRNNEVIHREIAMNEVVIHRWVTPSIIEIVTHIDGVFLNSQRSDGLIISTPTGSTAYSLSAGGPIMSPSLNVLVLVPLSPHTLSNRPIVIDDSSTIEISFCQSKQINALVTCDNKEIPEVTLDDKILIRKLPTPITILHPQDHDFFEILRKKLNWSGG